MDNYPENSIANNQAVVALTLHPKAQLLKILTDTIPTNDYGLPEYLYRSDLLDIEAGSHLDDQAQALMHLDYSQGYPSLPSGEAIWSPLPFEDIHAYDAFKHYMEMPRSTKEGLSAPIRQLNVLRPLTGKSTTDLLSWSYMHFWPMRARAYDLFVIASHTRAKELRMQEVEDSHYTRAQKYIDYAEVFLEAAFADPESVGLTPKEAFDMMFKMMQAQRLSVGLSPNGQHANKEVNQMPVNASMELILRTIARNAGIEGADAKISSNITQQLFSDPKALEQAQELIIKMSSMKNPRSQKQGNFLDD